MTAIKKIQLSKDDIFDIHATEADAADKLNANAGSTTKPVYFESGIPIACGFEVKTSVPENAKFTDTDTKNTAGASKTTQKIYLIGAQTQEDGVQTYSNEKVYVTEGHLYSNNKKVSTTGHTHNYLPLAGGTLTGNIVFENEGTGQNTVPSLTWETVGTRTPYFGYSKNQTDGTFVWSTSGDEYSSGLAIGGSSGSLLWQKNKVMTAIDKLANPNTLIINVNGTENLKYDGDTTKEINLTPSLIGAAPQFHNHDASDITGGTLDINRIPSIPINKGGTGGNTVEKARENLGIYSTAEVDAKIDKIVGEGAAETLDTIGKISEALKGDKDIIDALTPSKSFDDHLKDDQNPHKVTKSTIGLDQVDNKSVADILNNDLDSSHIINALGYTPPAQDTDTTYTFATGDENGQIKITPSNANAQNVSVKGLGTAAYKNVGDFATTGRNEFTGAQILANNIHLFGTFTNGNYGDLIGLNSNDNIVIGGSSNPDTNINIYGKVNLNHALLVTEGGTGATTATGAINNISSGAIQLGDSGISILTVNGIDYAMTSAEYDELIALT